MSSLTLWDHLFVAYVALLFPLYAWRTFPAEVRRIEEGGEDARVAAYRRTVLSWVIHGLLLLALWVATERAWADLGFGAAEEPWRLAAGIALGGLLVALAALNPGGAALRNAGRAGIRKQVGKLAEFLPGTRREERWFRVVSVNAGITEELIYRAFLLWYLLHFVGTARAAVLMVVVFTIAHAYQGLRQLPGIAFVSAALVGVYLLSGSIVVAVIVHALVDVMQGRNIVRAIGEQRAAPAPQA